MTKQNLQLFIRDRATPQEPLCASPDAPVPLRSGAEASAFTAELHPQGF